MTCTNPIFVKDKISGKDILVPCGQCTACRIKRSTEWKYRLMAELPYWNYNACFVTLTYDDEHLPVDRSLNKEDLKKFFKRLRKDLVLEGRYHITPSGSKSCDLKYYACGEYGDITLRPHYHAIIFGLNYDEHDRQLIMDNWRLCDPLRFKKSNGQEKGFAPVSPEDIGYVTGYVQKKYSGKLAKNIYGDRLPPFSVNSQGLGLRFAEDNKDRVVNNMLTINGTPISVPRYFIRKLGIDHFEDNYRNHVRSICDYIINTCGSSHYQFLINCLGQGRFELIETKYRALKEQSFNQLEKNLKAKAEIKGNNYEV